MVLAGSQISATIADGEDADFDKLEMVALQLATIRIDLPAQLKLMLDAVKFLYLSGHSFRAIPIAQKAHMLGLETLQTAATLDALMALGICSADSGALPDSMEAYAEALSLAQGLSDPVRQGKVWLNLGAALIYSGLYREALACFEKGDAIVAFEEGWDLGRSVIFSNIAICHLHLDEIRHGLIAIQRADELAPAPKNSYDLLSRSLLEVHYTRLLLEANDFEGAKRHAKRARQFADESKSPRADIFSAVAEALVDVFSGQADAGIARLLNTLDRSRALQITTHDVLLAVVKAYEFVGKSDEALIYLRQLLAYQNATQKQNIFQHVKLHLKQLHPALEDEASAIQRLQTREELLEGRVAKQELTRRSQELFAARIEVIERMAVAAELRDDASGMHPYRVGKLASLLAREHGCDEEMIFMINIAARLHDIGKIGIPDNIVLKNGALKAVEREAMKTHTDVGADLIRKSHLPNVQMAVEIAHHHHDWWNGTGASVAAGEGIPVAARIVAIADVYDSLIHARPYKPAWRHEDVIVAIMERRGTQFDPQLTDRFIELMERLVAEHDDLDAYLGSAAKDSTFLQARRAIADAMTGRDLSSESR